MKRFVLVIAAMVGVESGCTEASTRAFDSTGSVDSTAVPTLAYDFVTLDAFDYDRVFAASGTLAVGVTATNDRGRPALWRAGVREYLPTPVDGTYQPSAVNHAGTIVGTRTWKPDSATTCSQPVVWTNGEARLIPGPTPCSANTRGIDINESGQVLLDGPPSVLNEATTTPVPRAVAVWFIDDSARVLGTVDTSWMTPPHWFLPSGVSIGVTGTGDPRTVYTPIAIDASGCVLQSESTPNGVFAPRVHYTVACLDGRRVLTLDEPALAMLPDGSVLTSTGRFETRANKVYQIIVTGHPAGFLGGTVWSMSDTGVIYLRTERRTSTGNFEPDIGLAMLVPRQSLPRTSAAP